MNVSCIRAFHATVPGLRRAFWALSRNAEWVMYPAQAWGRQMNYNISFSRPYIPTDRAYWRVLIAFNSLLVQSCNVNAGRGRDTFSAVTRDRVSFPFFFLPSIPDSPPSYSSALFARHPSSPSSPLLFDSPRHRLVVEIIIALFFPFARRRAIV